MRPLLSLIRRQRAKSTALSDLCDSDFLLHIVETFTVPDDTPEDVTALTRAFACVFRPGPDCTGAVELLRDAGVGEFDLDDLNQLRRNPAFAHIRKVFDAMTCKELDIAEQTMAYHTLRGVAMQAGRPADW